MDLTCIYKDHRDHICYSFQTSQSLEKVVSKIFRLQGLKIDSIDVEWLEDNWIELHKYKTVFRESEVYEVIEDKDKDASAPLGVTEVFFNASYKGQEFNIEVERHSVTLSSKSPELIKEVICLLVLIDLESGCHG